MHTISVRPREGAQAKTPILRRRLSAIFTIFVVSSTLAQAAPAPAFPELLRLAQSTAPQLLEEGANVRAAHADVRQAGALRNPTLDANAENIGAPTSGGVTQRQDTYTLTQVFELGAKRTVRIEAEQRKADAAGARAQHARLAYASQLAVAYATAEAMQQRQAVAEADAATAADDLRAAQALVKAGREAELRVAQARASAAAAQAVLESASANTTEAMEKLAALAGANEAFTRIDHAFLSAVRAPAELTNWTASQAPALATAVAESDAVAAQVRVEQKKNLPDIGVSVGMRRFGWSNDKAATVSVSVNIPLLDRNKAGIDAARERAAAASMRVEAARLEAQGLHRSAIAQLHASDKRLQAAEQSEQAATDAYRLGRVGYDAGKTALIELLSIRRALSEARLLTIDTRLARVRALASLSLAEGRNVFGEVP